MKDPSGQDWPIGVTAVMLPSLDFDEQLALCRELGLTHYVFRPRVIPGERRAESPSPWGVHRFDLTPTRLIQEGKALGQRVRAAGMVPFGTVPHALADDDEAALRLHLHGAAEAGCRCVRVNPPRYPAGLFDYEAYLHRLIDLYRRAVALARPLGIKLVIEMHAGTAATGPGLARLIVQGFDPAELGLILDLPNAALEGFVQPALSISAVEPWIDHLHVGGARLMEADRDAQGFVQMRRRMTALVDSGLHVPEWIALLKQMNRRPPLIIEDYDDQRPDTDRLRDTAEQLRRLL